MNQALDQVKILDLSTGCAGPLGVLLLAEQGADVIKVEPPGGDPFRAYEGYAVWTRSRRSVTCDLQSDVGRSAFLKLVETADVVVESFRPGVMERLGIGWETLNATNPRLVLASVPGWPAGHRNAHRPAYDALIQAAAGQQWEQPGWRAGPTFLPMPMPSMGAIFLLSGGITSALIAREKTGRGQHVATSLLQGALLYTTQIQQYIERADAVLLGLMAKTYPPGVHQGMIFECANREFIHVSIMSGLPPMKPLDEILGVIPPPANETEGLLPLEIQLLMTDRLRAACQNKERSALVDELRANNIAVEPVVSPAEQFAHPQLQANEMVATVEQPGVGTTTQIGVPIHLLGTPGSIKSGQPEIGEHNQNIWSGLGYSDSDLATISGAKASAPSLRPTTPVRSEPRTTPMTNNKTPEIHALEGLRLIDFGQYLAGPFGPMILSDFGMDVIKVEPVTGDGMRMAGTPFLGCQRGKRDLALNVKDPAGLEIAMRLVGTADVVHHNMTRGTASRLGIDYEACRQARADIIYCNTYAYGLADPLGHFGGLDPLYQASAGLEFEAGGVPHGHDPLYYRFGMCDAANAMLSVVGVLTALYHRARTGEGQELWTSLMDGGAVFASDVLIRPDGTPSERPVIDANGYGFGPGYRLYPTQEGWLQVCAVSEAEWTALGAAVGIENDAINTGKRENHTTTIEAAFLTRTALNWSRILDDAGVPNEIAVDTLGGQSLLFDSDNVALGLVADYEHSILGRIRQFGATVNFSDTPGRIFGPPPLVGEHSRQILEDLGYSGSDQEDLRKAGVVYWPDADYPWGW